MFKSIFMITKPWKLIGNLAIALVVLFIILILGFIVINSKDQPPSATAIEFQQSWDNKKPVDVADNGYIYLLGFDVAENLDPKVVGAERIQWSKEIIHSSTEEFIRFPQAYSDFQKQLPKEIIKLVDLCSQITNDCISNIDKQHELIQQWSQNEAWIINRYQQLIAHKTWLELIEPDIRLPFPSYGDVMKAQRLTFIHAFSNMQTDNSASVAELLDKDLRFWRTMLKDTDMLIGKMIAVAAIKNNFLWTNRILLRLDENARSGTMLTMLNQPFVDEELSMRRCLIGEWSFAHSVINPLDGSGIDNLTGQFFLKFLYQKQDTLNNHAASLNSIVLALDVPLSNFEATLESYQQKLHPEKPLIHYLQHPYNIAGQIIGDIAPPSLYTDYVVRTKDLEAFRRGLLLSMDYMGFSSSETVPLVSPYETKPFSVNQEQQSVTVNGLGRDARAQQTYYY